MWTLSAGLTPATGEETAAYALTAAALSFVWQDYRDRHQS